MVFGLTVFLSLIWLFFSVSLYMWNLSTVSINLPFPVVYSTSMISMDGHHGVVII